MSDPDVLIVGAGPAGAIAALVLARAGVRVSLIDRARLPRHKLCGDTLNPGSLALLQQLGVAATVMSRSLPITGMTVTGPDGTVVTGDYPRSVRGAAIPRTELDLLLVEAAVDAGARFEHGLAARTPLRRDDDGAVCGVRVAARAGEHALRARVVIAADGRGSKIAGALGLSALGARPRRWAHGAYFTDVAAMTSRGEMHVRSGGYIGVAPLPHGVTNVCVVREVPVNGARPARRGIAARGEPVTGSRPPHHDPARLVEDAIAADPVLRERFARARRVSAVATLGPLAVECRAAGCAGLLLAGDAAGFVDPMTGDGLRFALRGGAMAATAALDELATGRPAFAALHAARAREFAGKWRINRALRALVGSPRGVTLAARMASHWPAPVQYLVGVAGDIALVDITNRGDAETRSHDSLLHNAAHQPDSMRASPRLRASAARGDARPWDITGHGDRD